MKKLAILAVIAIGINLLANSNEYVEIPSTSIRMRVIANSNDEKDQEEKKIIKSVVEEKLYELVEGKKDYDSIDEVIKEGKPLIDSEIQKTIEENKLGVTFSSNYGLNYFPEKEYRGLAYKAGNYKSFVVTLGEGEGENWWCVLYPPLCLVDENVDDYEYHYLIKDALHKYN